MLKDTIQNFITFITVNSDNLEIINIDEYISDYQEIKPIDDPFNL